MIHAGLHRGARIAANVYVGSFAPYRSDRFVVRSVEALFRIGNRIVTQGRCRGGLLFSLVAARQYLPDLSIVLSGF
jgi:hypothetical protein